MRVLYTLIIIFLTTGYALSDIVVATRNIRSNSIVLESDLKIVEGDLSNGFQSVDEVSGQEARVVLYAGRPITLNDVGPPALVERNQIVTLAYITGSLVILTDGRSLGRAGVGDRVRVLNLSSRSAVTGSVQADGTVSVSHNQY